MNRARTLQLDAEKLEGFLTERGWSLEDVASKADLSSGTMHRVLSGEAAYRRTAKAIADAFGVSVESILLDGRKQRGEERPVHEYRVDEVLTPWLEASNGLRFQICKMRHLELNRWARGKRYDLRKMSTEDEERCRAWFKRHADVCYTLKGHPNILRNITAFRAPSGDFWWIIDDWMDAMTLQQRLERGPLDRKEARTLMLGVADGLSSLHATRIIRRELNPASILITANGGTAVLTEFELAKLCDGAATVSSDSWPTDPYRAPEADSDDIDFRADLYSWGRVSLHALAGSLPTPGSDIELIGQQKLSAAVADVIERSLAVSRSGRPDDFSSVLAALKRWKVR